MKQTPQQNKNLILGDLLYAYRHVAELKGYIQTYCDAAFNQEHKGNLDMSLSALSSAIRLITESEIK